MTSWSDDRLDELSRRVDGGFEGAATKEELNRGFDEMDRRFDEAEGRAVRFEQHAEGQFARINDRLDKLFYAQIFFVGSLAVALLTEQI